MSRPRPGVRAKDRKMGTRAAFAVFALLLVTGAQAQSAASSATVPASTQSRAAAPTTPAAAASSTPTRAPVVAAASTPASASPARSTPVAATPAVAKTPTVAPTTRTAAARTVASPVAAPVAAAAAPDAAAAAPVDADAPIAADATLPSPTTGAVQGNATGRLTTKAQTNGPTIIVDGSGKEIIFKGIGWYGFNIGLASLGNLSAGIDAVSNDFKQIVYRQRMLGFNSIRVAFAFDNTWGINQPPLDWTSECVVPSQRAIRNTLIPDGNATTTLKGSTNTLPPLAPPEVPDGVCNADWPTDSTYARFVWVVDYLISQGFYVMLDFHSNRYGDSLAEGNESLYKQASWIQSWVALIKSILNNTPAAAGKLLIDLINEPDGYSLTWEQQGRVPSLGSYYLNTIDALYEICPGCLYLIEGGGQATYCGVNWGNGFITDQSIIKSLELSDPSPFFTSMLAKPWVNQVVLAPHIYCPAVSGATDCFSGPKMYDALDKSFGYLTVSPGFCSGTNCRVFPVILDEFGSTLNNENETSCMASIISYASGAVNPKTHAPLSSWFFWSWQPDSAGTGGIVADDWRTIVWEKIGLLTGGTKAWKTGLNLLPWYLDGFKDLTPVNTTVSSQDIALAPKAMTPVEPPTIAAAPVADIADPNSATQSQQTSQATPTPTIPAGFINGDNAVTSTPSGTTNIASLQTFGSTTSLANSKRLSSGALAGIIVGGVVFVALIAAVAILIIRLRNPRMTDSFTPTSGSQSPLRTAAP